MLLCPSAGHVVATGRSSAAAAFSQTLTVPEMIDGYARRDLLAHALQLRARLTSRMSLGVGVGGSDGDRLLQQVAALLMVFRLIPGSGDASGGVVS